MKALALTALLFATAAFADEKVAVVAEVVTVSKQGNEVDPPSLQTMKDEFKKSPQSAAYTSFKRVSTQKLVLEKGKSVTVQLLGSGQAQVRLDSLQQDTAQISVDVPKLVKTSLTLGKKGALYQQVSRQGTDPLVFLVLSPGA